MSNPGQKHWDIVKGVMRYLHGSKEMCICSGGEDASIVGYTDVDYVGDLDKKRSTLGYVFTFTRGIVSWRSRLQDSTMLSNKYVVGLQRSLYEQPRRRRAHVRF